MMKDLIPWGKKGEKNELAAKGKGDIFSELQHEMNNLFNRFFEDAGETGLVGRKDDGILSKFLSPSFDVSETDDAIEVKAELPGTEEKDIEVTLDDNVLTVKGEKKSEREEKKKHYHLSECSYGSFQRSLPLPTGIDKEKIKADFKKGILKIHIPKTEEAKSKAKKIKIASE